MSWFFDAVPYILAAGTILLSALEIRKDWEDYKTSKLRITVASVFIVVAALSLVGLYHDGQERNAARVESEKAKTKSDGDMKALQNKADAANQAQVDNTKMYVESFKDMSRQIGDLKSQVKTQALQKKLDAVQAELLRTQKAMGPGPKAELSFSFVPYLNPAPPAAPTLKKEVTVPLSSDGSIHVEFVVINTTEVDTTDVALNLLICDRCKYAKEPAGFSKLPGREEKERFIHIPSLHAMEAVQAMNLDVIPPSGTTEMQVGFEYRCHSCTLQKKPSPEAIGTIHIISP